MNDEDEDIAKIHKLCTGEIFKIRGMGIDDSRLEIKKPKKSFNSSNNFEMSFIGELTDRKNQKFLIKFVKEIKKFSINIRLNLIGAGVLSAKLEKYAKKLNVSENISFISPIVSKSSSVIERPSCLHLRRKSGVVIGRSVGRCFF